MGYETFCPRYEKAIEVLGKKWTGLILRLLLAGPRRFGAIREQVPDLSDRVLSQRLKELEEAELVIRIVHATKPVTVEYRLTEKGQALEAVVASIQTWAEQWC